MKVNALKTNEADRVSAVVVFFCFNLSFYAKKVFSSKGCKCILKDKSSVSFNISLPYHESKKPSKFIIKIFEPFCKSRPKWLILLDS